jgi:hypothetical protein
MVIFSKDHVFETSHKELLAAGFRCLNWGTVYDCYTKDGERNVYVNTKTMEFFRNPEVNLDNNLDKVSKLRIIIAGGRDFNDYELLKGTMDRLLRKRSADEVEIVCGEAPGADSLGKRYAIENGMSVASFPADWDGHGRAAGPIRNGQMADYATHCVCFWDGRSKGTKNMINQAKQRNLHLKVVQYS